MSKDDRAPKIEGSSDPYHKGRVLVPIQRRHRSFPKVVLSQTPATTFYSYDNKARRLAAMKTDCGNGIMVGWDECGACVNHIRRCTCRNGITPPSSVIHIFKMTGGTMPEPSVFTEQPLRRLRPAVTTVALVRQRRTNNEDVVLRRVKR